LTFVDYTGPKPRLVIDQAVSPLWQRLNPTERYAALLETWLLNGHPAIIGETGYRSVIAANLAAALHLFTWLSGQGLTVKGDPEVRDRLLFTPGWHNLGLLDLFGLITIQSGTPEVGEGWPIEQIEATPLGEALAARLQAHFPEGADPLTGRTQGGRQPAGTLQPFLQPYWPAWQANLSLPE
jgi:hypothetical protein